MPSRLNAQPSPAASKIAVVPACTAFASRLLAAETSLWTTLSMSISPARVAHRTAGWEVPTPPTTMNINQLAGGRSANNTQLIASGYEWTLELVR